MTSMTFLQAGGEQNTQGNAPFTMWKALAHMGHETIFPPHHSTAVPLFCVYQRVTSCTANLSYKAIVTTVTVAHTPVQQKLRHEKSVKGRVNWQNRWGKEVLPRSRGRNKYGPMKGVGWSSGAWSLNSGYKKRWLWNPEQPPQGLCAVVPLLHANKHPCYFVLCGTLLRAGTCIFTDRCTWSPEQPGLKTLAAFSKVENYVWSVPWFILSQTKKDSSSKLDPWCIRSLCFSHISWPAGVQAELLIFVQFLSTPERQKAWDSHPHGLCLKAD